MHIKQIIIKNFKSFGESTAVELLDEGHNVIVGPNGGGKSNLCSAIQFVLGDEFAHLENKQRQSLLNGDPKITSSGFVEIVFNNADRRISFAEDEVSIRRTFNNENDEYTINNSVVSRTKVMEVFEDSGFTIRNPYYIVEQEKVNHLATLQDNDRLQLLKEVSGFDSYAKMYCQSLEKLKFTQNRLLHFEDLIKNLRGRLYMLEKEKKNFHQFEKQDKLRRTLQKLICEMELSQTKQKLSALETLRNEAVNQQTLLGQKLESTQAELDRYFRILNKTKMNISFFETEKESVNHHYQCLLKARVKLIQNMEKELTALRNQIQESEAELEVNCRFDKVNVESNNKNRELMLKELQFAKLYEKQICYNQFSDRTERDTWIRNKLESIHEKITVKREREDCLREGIKADVKIENELVNEIKEKSRIIEQNQSHKEGSKNRCRAYDKLLELGQYIRNEISSSENIESQYLLQLQEELSTTNKNFCAKVGSAVVNGNESIQKVLTLFKERGGSDADIVKAYHGTVMENFECDKNLHAAVEVMAGETLLYHIVDSDEVIKKIVKEINRMELPGKFTFISMNCSHFRDVLYPNNKDTTPMIHKLSYEFKYNRVFRYLFRKILICRNLDVAIAMAASTNLECVTMNGDKVIHSEILSGDSIDNSKLSLEIYSVRQGLIKSIHEATQKFSEKKIEQEKSDIRLKNIPLEIQKCRDLNIELQIQLDRLDKRLLLLKNQLTSVQEVRASKEMALAKLQADLKCLLVTKQSLDLELEQDFLCRLSKSDQQKLNLLNKEIQILRKNSKKDVDDISHLARDKNKLNNFCVKNSYKKRQVGLDVLQKTPFEKRKNKLSALDSKLKESNQKIERVAEDLAEKDCRINKMLQQLDQEQIQFTRLTLCKKDILIEIDKQSETLETFAFKQILHDMEIAEITVRIYEVGGVLSDDMYIQYSHLSLPSLVQEMDNVTNLQKDCHVHVNKNAVMQSENCSIELEGLLQTKKELCLCLTNYQNLLVSITKVKFQILFNAFRKVSKNFAEVFKTLVPTGRAKMVMLSTEVEEGYEYLPATTNVDNFVGIAIKVSFQDSEDPMLDMMQLSNGEKLLVALGLIFAIQKFKPAPFYLFDEIDRGLDINYRKALTELIHELPDENQFITITCQPQLLKYAKKFYGIMLENNGSLVKCITKDNAVYFVNEDDD